MFAKMSDTCSDTRVRTAIEGYVQCERDVRESDKSLPLFTEEFTRCATLLWGDFLSEVDRRVYNGDLVPKHGPGSVADKLSSNAKWRQLNWTERLEKEFPHWEYLIPSFSFLSELNSVVIAEPGAEVPVKVITVPKTLKTPRIIAVEPTCMMFMQQALLKCFEESLKDFDSVREIFGWHSQEPNKLMACDASRTGKYATLDLSEASDRVSNQHVRLLLHRFPSLLRGIDACRSRKADVPGFGVLRLAKFASMGSALCFPMESMVFATLAFVGIQRALKRPLTRKDIMSLEGEVRVYGDDIIVPVDYVHSVIDVLEDFGLRVNVNKSFWTGKFREPCGGDFYDGVDVSIVRLRSDFPTKRKHVREIISTVSTRNQLYKAGLWRSAYYLDTLLEGLMPLPYVAENSPLLGRTSFLGVQSSKKMHRDYQYPLVRGMVVSTSIPEDFLDGYGALQKCLTLLHYSYEGTSLLPKTAGEHLERAGRPRTVNIKTRWASPV